MEVPGTGAIEIAEPACAVFQLIRRGAFRGTFKLFSGEPAA
jgi:hypothetical protein